MNVLSLFDGISCGQVALQRAGIPVEQYYASEIDKYAISITQKNYPNTIQLGDVNSFDSWDLSRIDLMIGGSPCQDLSIAKNGRQGLDGERSGLFWKYIDCLKKFKPKWFLLENVNSMPKEAKQIITETLGVEPIMINSALVSAQQRKRLYWTNIPNITQPEDKGILLKDVLETMSENPIVINNEPVILQRGHGFNKGGIKKNKCPSLTSQGSFEQNNFVCYNFYNNKMIKDKSPSLTQACGCLTSSSSVAKIIPVGEIPNDGYRNGNQPSQEYRIYDINAKHPSLNSFRTNIAESIKIGQFNKGGQGDRIYSVFGKSVSLNVNGGGGGAKTGLYKIDLPDGDYIIIKLTPIECERLQTLPDNYTDGVSNSQRYKCLGNGWTVDVIAHILSFIPKEGL